MSLPTNIWMFIENLYCGWKAAATERDPHSYYAQQFDPAVCSLVELGQRNHEVPFPVGKTIDNVVSIEIQRQDPGNSPLGYQDYYLNVAEDGIIVYLDAVPIADDTHKVCVTFR